MFIKLQKTFFGQLVILVSLSILAALVCYSTGFQPRLRASVLSFVRGATGGLIFGGLLLGGVSISRILFKKVKLRQWSFDTIADHRSIINRLSGIFAVSIGEELFFRAFVFGYLSFFAPIWAFVLNGVLGFVCYFFGKSSIPRALFKSVCWTFLAALYLYHRSLFMVVVASIVIELMILFSSSKKAIEAT